MVLFELCEHSLPKRRKSVNDLAFAKSQCCLILVLDEGRFLSDGKSILLVLIRIGEYENTKSTQGNRVGNTCLDSLAGRKSLDGPEIGLIQFLTGLGGDMRSLKTRIERIKETVKELGWYCVCLLAVMIFKNLEP